MAKATNRAPRAPATLFCLLVITACAEGTPPITGNDQADSNAGAASGGQAQSGSSGSGLAAGTTDGGSSNAGGTPSTGGTSDGASGSEQLAGGASSSAAGASAGESSGGGSATAGASSGGKGGTSAGGSGGSAAVGGGGSSAGSGGAPAACSGTKPESNCVCHSNSGHDYFFCPTARNFVDAESKCVSASLHLVKVTSAAEDTWVNDTANAATFGEYYLGGTDANTPNTWTWLAGGTFWTGLASGTASGYAHWGSSQPDGSGTCVVVQNNFVWDDRICTDNRLYICD